jgi:hypothetical protein
VSFAKLVPSASLYFPCFVG